MNRFARVLLVTTLVAAPALTAQSTLTTLFASDNGGLVGGAVHFDLTVLNPAGVVVNRLDINAANPTNTQGNIELWTTSVGGTHVGNQVNPAPGTWTLRARANVVTAGNDNRTVANLDKPVALGPGTYGVTLVYVDIASRYTGTSANPASQTVFANTDIRLDLGTAQNVPFSSGIFSPRVANLTLYYNLLAADVADFSFGVRSGASPLSVAFTDLSRTPSGAISAWAWDFDNDGVVDSTLQNPVANYPACGDYSVRLTVTAPGGASSVTWANLIEVDPLVADFTATPASGPPPLNVQFADTSTIAATSWAWDFDGDGVTDSTQQNPSALFDPGAHGVSLTVTNGCRSDTVTKRITATTDAFQTNNPFNANSFINTQSVVFFDLTVTATEALSISALDVNSYTPVGRPLSINVWLTETTWSGKHTLPDAWRLAGTGTGVTAGANATTEITLERPILLLPGQTYGVGIHYPDSASYYINPPATITTPDLTLTPGAAAYSPNGPFTNQTLFTPRQWMGTLHYLRQSQWPQAGWTWFAEGCAGSLGLSQLRAMGTDRPLLGSTMRLEAANLPIGTGLLLLGLSNTQSVFGALPLPLANLGLPGCTAFVSTDDYLLLAPGPMNSGTLSLTFPANPNLAGLQFFNQVIVLDPGFNNRGAVMSDAFAGLIGSF